MFLHLAWAGCAVMLVGCLIKQYNFDPPPYSPIGVEQVPLAVKEAFDAAHPGGTIEQVQSRRWPPTGKEHFEFQFEENGLAKRCQYRDDGSEIR